MHPKGIILAFYQNFVGQVNNIFSKIKSKNFPPPYNKTSPSLGIFYFNVV
jgi:hypothetical protein